MTRNVFIGKTWIIREVSYSIPIFLNDKNDLSNDTPWYFLLKSFLLTKFLLVSYFVSSRWIYMQYTYIFSSSYRQNEIIVSIVCIDLWSIYITITTSKSKWINVWKIELQFSFCHLLIESQFISMNFYIRNNLKLSAEIKANERRAGENVEKIKIPYHKWVTDKLPFNSFSFKLFPKNVFQTKAENQINNNHYAYPNHWTNAQENEKC